MSEDDVSNNGDDGLYIVERILDKRRKGGVAQYFIKWRGYDKPEDNTWEPVENCDCPDLIKEFEEKLAAKKGKKDNRQSRSSSTATPTPADTPGSSGRGGRGQRRARTSAVAAPTKKIKLTSSRVIMDSSSDSDSSIATPPPAKPAEKEKPKSPEKVTSPSKKTPTKKKKTPPTSPTRARTTSDATSTEAAPVAPADINGVQPTGLAAARTTPFVPTRVPELIPPVTENGETRVLHPLRPSSELTPLAFKVTKVNGIYNDNGYLMAVVSCDKDEDYRCVELKAVGRQDLDMLVDFLVTRLEV